MDLILTCQALTCKVLYNSTLLPYMISLQLHMHVCQLEKENQTHKYFYHILYTEINLFLDYCCNFLSGFRSILLTLANSVLFQPTHSH